MHRSTILLVPVLCAPLMLVGCGRDASKPAATTPAASTSASGESAGANGTLVKVAQIDGIDANDEFTHNVGVLQAGREEVMRMDESLKKLPAGKDHDDLQARMDAALKKLESDNQTMAKTYGYSILRNYVRIPEVAHVYLVLTDEEAAKQPAPKDGSAPSKVLKVCSLTDAQANQSFQDTVQKLQQMRQQAATMKAAIDKAGDSKDKAYQQGQFDLLLKQLNEANEAAAKTYAFNLNRQYQLQIEKSTLYIAASPEEAAAAAKVDGNKDAKADGKPADAR